MSKPATQQYYFKKLIKIIHQKQTQIEQYRRLLKEKFHESRIKVKAQTSLASCLYDPEFAKQITANQIHIKQVTEQLKIMQEKISQLHQGLIQEENKNIIMQQKLNMMNKQNNDLKEQVHSLKVKCNQLERESSKYTITNNNQQKLRLEVTKQQLEIMNLKEELADKQDKISQVQAKIEKYSCLCQQICKLDTNFHSFLQGNSENKIDCLINQLEGNNSILENVVNVLQNQKQIYNNNQNQIDKNQIIIQNLNQQIKELLELAKEKDTKLQAFEQQIIHHHQKHPEQSFDGLSQIMKSRFKIHQNSQSSFYEKSEYRQYQENLIKELQQEMGKNYPDQNDVPKQKLVELSQIRQSLKMTKQVNAQLFQQIQNSQCILRQVRNTVNVLLDKNLIKGQAKQKLCMSLKMPSYIKKK